MNNDRDDDKAGYFHMSIRDNQGSDQDVVTASAESVRPIVGDIQKRRFEFRPPGQLQWHTFFSQQVNLPLEYSASIYKQTHKGKGPLDSFVNHHQRHTAVALNLKSCF